MADDSSSTFQAGQTGLIIKVPEAEAVVRSWREQLDPSAQAGVPAHVTVHFPFLEESRVDSLVRAAVEDLLENHRAFDVRFASCGRFPGILYLAPEPDGQLRRLTQAIAERWPEAPPFGGRFTDIVPHLTVAHHEDSSVLDEVETAVTALLPVTTRVSSIELVVHDGAMWRERASFPLQQQ